MPELPEVEVNRKGLDKLVKGKKIKNINVFWKRIVVQFEENPNVLEALIDETVLSVDRRGKYLLFRFPESYLVSHLRMEGKYFYFPEEEVPLTKDKHTHVIIEFHDKSQLHYNDVRKFGRLEYVPKNLIKTCVAARKSRPEPTETGCNIQEYRDQLEKCRPAVETALLAQEIVAGLRNIYVDHVLCEAQIHLPTVASELSDIKINTLYHAIIN